MPSVKDRFFAALAQGASIGSQGAGRRSDQEAKSTLEQLLQAKRAAHEMDKQTSSQAHDMAKLSTAEQQAIRETDRNLGKARNFSTENPGTGIGLSGTGGVTISPKTPSEFTNFRREAHTDGQTRGVADRTEKAGIPRVATALQGAEKSFNGKSVGPLMNILPGAVQGVAANVKSSLGDLFNKPEWQGAGEEFQDLQRLMNIDIREFAGAAQTQAETAKQMIEKGLSPGGTPAMVERGVQMMRSAATAAGQNIEAGSNREALSRYADQNDGKTPTQILGPAPTPKFNKPAGAAQERTVTKRQYSPSRNKTRVTYSDGTVEEQNGQI